MYVNYENNYTECENGIEDERNSALLIPQAIVV